MKPLLVPICFAVQSDVDFSLQGALEWTMNPLSAAMCFAKQNNLL